MTPRSGQFRVRPAGRTRSMIRTRPIFTGQGNGQGAIAQPEPLHRNDLHPGLLACRKRSQRLEVGSLGLTGARSEHGPRQLLDRYRLNDDPLVDARGRDELVVLDLVVVPADLDVVAHGAVFAAVDLVDERVGLVGVIGRPPVGDDVVGEVGAGRPELLAPEFFDLEREVAELGVRVGARRVGGGGLLAAARVEDAKVEARPEVVVEVAECQQSRGMQDQTDDAGEQDRDGAGGVRPPGRWARWQCLMPWGRLRCGGDLTPEVSHRDLPPLDDHPDPRTLRRPVVAAYASWHGFGVVFVTWRYGAERGCPRSVLGRSWPANHGQQQAAVVPEG